MACSQRSAPARSTTPSPIRSPTAPRAREALRVGGARRPGQDLKRHLAPRGMLLSDKHGAHAALAGLAQDGEARELRKVRGFGLHHDRSLVPPPPAAAIRGLVG